MLTKNFYTGLGNSFTATPGKFVTVYGTETTGYSLASSSYGVAAMMATQHSISTAGTITQTGVVFGEGTTPATLDDYKLEKEIGHNIISAILPPKASVTYGDDAIELTATYGLSATEEVTISEIGLVSPGTTPATMATMFDRTVLDEPITLKPGETKQVTYTIRLNYPTA